MKKRSNILDIPSIKKHIHSAHKEFIDEVGRYSYQIIANKDLFRTRMAAKIYAILECFVEEKIIDEVIVKDESICKCFQLIKKNMQKSVNIWTDGENIVIEDNNLFILSELKAPYKKVYYNIVIDEYDWVKFSKELLDYIHWIIYNKKEAYEARIFK